MVKVNSKGTVIKQTAVKLKNELVASLISIRVKNVHDHSLKDLKIDKSFTKSDSYILEALITKGTSGTSYKELPYDEFDIDFAGSLMQLNGKYMIIIRSFQIIGQMSTSSIGIGGIGDWIMESPVRSSPVPQEFTIDYSDRRPMTQEEPMTTTTATYDPSSIRPGQTITVYDDLEAPAPNVDYVRQALERERRDRRDREILRNVRTISEAGYSSGQALRYDYPWGNSGVQEHG